jgi:hypothetical protein
MPGAIILRYSDPRPAEIAGRLLDMSEQGFRVAHFDPTLQPGRIVRFHHVTMDGQACVMWTRSLADHVESGLRILDR